MTFHHNLHTSLPIELIYHLSDSDSSREEGDVEELYSASERGDILTVRRLISRGVDVNECDEVCQGLYHKNIRLHCKSKQQCNEIIV